MKIPRQTPTRAQAAEQAADVDAYGRVLIDQHARMELAGACGITWGQMAPAADQPGTVHWCTRALVDGGPHRGRHRCGCGDYHDGASAVVCRYPVNAAGKECGQLVTGLQRVQQTRPGSISAGRAAFKFQIVTSMPCGHVVKRGF